MITETFNYITFKLGSEVFALNVNQVREVLELSRITRVPSAPAWMRGLVNVRGKAIPVTDLRLRFGLEDQEDSVNTRVIVLELEIDGEPVVLGGIADSVHEVIEIEPASIEPPPQIAMRWRTEFIRGMGRRGEDFIIILDASAVFSSDEALLIAETAGVGEGRR